MAESVTIEIYLVTPPYCTNMSYNVDEKMSGLASVLYTEFNDIISIDYNDNIVVEVKDKNINRYRIFDKVLGKLRDIEQKQSIAIVYQYTEDLGHDDDKLKIKVVKNYDNVPKNEWYHVSDLD